MSIGPAKLDNQIACESLEAHKAEQIELYVSLRHFIRMECNNTSRNQISPVVQELMAKSLFSYMQDATRKFIRGQQEHGGDIRDRDLRKELYYEHIDSFWYTVAEKWPTHLR